ncbi:hypothetical protein N7448_000073 [Penicillium atrosanguineum]|uniref:Zinc finger CHCC-type n=1 Tax=Penicillium atrosanguineum TaxID=1132637 RepID=UPI002383EB7A|nr:Zinc finger CHCC-type [Penicillium atrosanguineum]KAJ5148495.1 hypothetical protein N7448_000073 [Penicillium atrosanguineum]KAJ5303815.1 Zinc finger CHCC-type [Penicillium atrosanguineum]
MAGRLFRWPGAMRQSAISQARSYASKSAIPTFSPTSSSELNDALDRFRRDLFIPAGLPKRQRTSMYKEKYAQRLRDEPITINISETEEYTLQPKKHIDSPKKSDAIEVIKMMQATEDYKNFIPFVSGLRGAQYSVTDDHWEQIIRKAGGAHKLHLIIECARQSEITGLRLRNLELVKTIFFTLHLSAQKAEFKGPEVGKALNMAKQAVDIMDADLPDHSYSAPSMNPKSQPVVIAALLELSAARAINDFAGKDNDKEVLGYTQKLLASAPKGHYQKGPSDDGRKNLNNWIREASTVYNGLRMCQSIHGIAADKVLNREVSSRLDEVKKSLKTVVEDSTHKDKDSEHWKHARELLQG